jgi:hypothetical protein
MHTQLTVRAFSNRRGTALEAAEQVELAPGYADDRGVGRIVDAGGLQALHKRPILSQPNHRAG